MDPEKLNEISFGAESSADDYRTVEADQASGQLPERAKVALDYDYTNELCDQRRLGICTMCGVRMAAEHHFHDGVRLDEYWGYLIGKLLVQGNLNEGSSALHMLKGANKFGIPSKAMLKKYPLKTFGSYSQFIEDFQSKYGGQIPDEVLEDAKKHKIPGYYKVSVDPRAIAKEVSEGRLPIIRMVVGDNFYTDKDGRRSHDAEDLLPLRIPKKIDSGHIMCINEYKGLDGAQEVEGPNSWGDDWAAKGYFLFIFQTQAPYYFTEAWGITPLPPEVIQRVKDMPEAKNFSHTFGQNVERGDVGEEVRYVQIALCILGFLDIKVDELGTYGPKTAKAVLAYQKARKLLPDATLEANGGNYVHGLTRGALNKDFSK